MADADLAAALKQAKSKKMFFAFIPKGAHGKLIISKVKITAKEIAEAKKEIGGGNAIIGKCSGPHHNLVFEVSKAAPPNLHAALKLVAKRDAALGIVPVIQLLGELDEEDEEDTDTSSKDNLDDPRGGKSSQTPDEDTDEDEDEDEDADDSDEDSDKDYSGKPAKEKNDREEDEDEDEDDEDEMDEADEEKLDIAIWLEARKTAIDDLKEFAKKCAAAKHGHSATAVKAVQKVIGQLPAKVTQKDIDKLEDFIKNDAIITAAEAISSKFHDLDIREPLLKAIEGLRK